MRQAMRAPGKPRLRRRLLAVSLTLAAFGLVAAALALDHIGVAPRQLGPYLEERARGHHPVIEAAGRWLNACLVALDRGDSLLLPDAALRLGAQDAAAAIVGADRQVLVSNVDELRAALARAVPGDALTLLPGNYHIAAPLQASRPGSAAAPITLRARRPGSVTLQVTAMEGIRASAPYWRFENLVLRGACNDDAGCEHALHVVGAAHDVAIVNNTIVDFNAHIKINGEHGAFPDHGLAEANTLTNTHARMSAGPVTPIDLVAASDWTFRRNFISDFVKAAGDRISYGAFAKGGGARNVFEQNVIWCERHLAGYPGQRVGLSLGGGGTGKAYCRDRACVVEQQEGALRGNLVASCSDVGIYLNNAARSSVLHNSIIDTGGVDVRYAGSSADLEGNLVDGAIRSRNGGVVREHDNRTAALLYAYLGYHPVRALWRNPPKRDNLAGTGATAAPDLCGAAPDAPPAYGAVTDLAACSNTTSSSSAAN